MVITLMTLTTVMKKLTVAWAVITTTLFVQEMVRPVAPASYGIDPVTVTLIGGMVVTVIGAIVTGIVTVITALRVSDVNARQSENALKIDTMVKDTEAIKGHVNSEKTEANGVLRLHLREIELLKESLQRSEQRAALLAQAAIQRIREAPVAGEAPAVLTGELVEKSLVKIDENTAAIKENTARSEESSARTEQNVQDLKDRPR